MRADGGMLVVSRVSLAMGEHSYWVVTGHSDAVGIEEQNSEGRPSEAHHLHI